jgi:hypothetical protein
MTIQSHKHEQRKTRADLMVANEELNSSLSIRQSSRWRSPCSNKELLPGSLRRRDKETYNTFHLKYI